MRSAAGSGWGATMSTLHADASPPTSPETLTRVQRALVALEAAKAELKAARAEEAEATAGARRLAREAARRAEAAVTAQARAAEDEAARAGRVAFDLAEAREGAALLLAAGFRRERETWVRDELRALLGPGGWATRTADGEWAAPVGREGLRGWISEGSGA